MGKPKFALPFGEETVLERVVRTMQGVADPVVVVGSREQRRPALPANVKFVQDLDDSPGPLAGFMRGLEEIAGQADAVLLCGCDMPLVRAGVLRLLIESLPDEAESAAIDASGKLQPLLAIYRPSLLARARQLLDSGERSLQALLRVGNCVAMPASAVTACDVQHDSLRRMNTLEEYEALLFRARESGELS
jgi:molybdopterin-guanine dinucleotide biosynthesis protein A